MTTKKIDKPDDNINTQTAKALDDQQKARVKVSDEANAKTQEVTGEADTTDKLVGTDEQVSRSEHSSGAIQPDDGTYDGMREQPPLAGRDVPQMLVVAENDTPTPGETNDTPKGGVSHAEAQRAAYIDTPEHHTKKGNK
jgi:hypothetical protein